MDQMYREIFDSDLCLALLKGHNPNVFYELGVAQSAGKPVIILNEKTDELPFDIRDLRAVSYDLKPRILFDQIFIKQIVSHLDNLATANWQVSSPFREYAAQDSNDAKMAGLRNAHPKSSLSSCHSGRVSTRDIRGDALRAFPPRAIARKKSFESNPTKHTYVKEQI
jgi:hypothetical protein